MPPPLKPGTPLTKADIAARIPHQGALCLLDCVTHWDALRIECLAISHRAADNPLRRQGRLGAVIGIEYAAQAMAVHGALLAERDAPPQKGLITRVQQVQWHTERLDGCTAPLSITAERLMGDARMVRYQFWVCCGALLLLEGAASVLLDVG